MTDIVIPPEVVEAAAKAAQDKWRHECAADDNGFVDDVSEWLTWSEIDEGEREGWRTQARAALAHEPHHDR